MVECQHLTEIFSNNSKKDEFLTVYYSTKSTLSRTSVQDKLRYTMICSECHQLNNGTSFLCIQCGNCGCWNGSHSMNHYKSTNHPFGVNSLNGLLYCFHCNDYVFVEELLLTPKIQKYWNRISNETSIPTLTQAHGLKGLVNMGSTCYMSSILQCLMHNPLFVDLSMKGVHYNYCKIQDPMKCMSCAIDNIISETYGNKKTTPNEGLVDILNCSWRVNKNLAGYTQQDAHEFLQFILNQMHNDYKLNEIHDTNKQEMNGTDFKTMVNGNSSKEHLHLCNCLPHTIFQGFLKSIISCSECKAQSQTTIDPYMDLSLDVKGKSTLYECLESFHRTERLHDFTYNCKKCNKSQDANRQLSILKLAPIMVIQLKRFEHLITGSSVKINDFVEFPLHLNMKSFCTAPTPDTDPTNLNEKTNKSTPDMIYELTGIVTHRGTVNEGHYITYTKTADGVWYQFNDSVVMKVPLEQMLKEQAYLLIYTIRQFN
ncbi:hypothetical protein TBLA_0D01070 [Henningerozyma blattae CBS 6284]|uniref:Ubiquitin carboxyl-terminal hydrolase n=1 Tax=Henningerozyma blattae (strain ATCC 34711 / CBS 6284 / DSM 70876 / NBRC 10599 / NRRL Y-10934 / UCD 77-7) TaxID=1071380 RepID=I2H2L3_HENB6|nr:hypothetical protein TBLA_0D01070 [Tetrapisispora blattae CBS 6284]CCH60615.1 hypothetical protein TBLA_0D01070 [Tetrapisispora blattae CBS 6284]